MELIRRLAVAALMIACMLPYFEAVPSRANDDEQACVKLKSSFEKSGLLTTNVDIAVSIAQEASAICNLARSGNATAQFKLGKLFYRKRLYEDSFYWFNKSAEQGNLDALAKLALAYYKGHGVEKSDAKAAELLKRSADRGSAYGKAILSEFLLSGTLLPKDRDKGIELLREAAVQGSGYAAARLGNQALYSDVEEGLKWLRISAGRGDPYGQFSLGYLYYAGSYGLGENFAEFFRLALLSAAGGHTPAQKMIAQFYCSGSQLPKNVALAEYWFGEAITGGDPSAKKSLESCRRRNGPPSGQETVQNLAAITALIIAVAALSDGGDSGDSVEAPTPLEGLPLCAWGEILVGGDCIPINPFD